MTYKLLCLNINEHLFFLIELDFINKRDYTPSEEEVQADKSVALAKESAIALFERDINVKEIASKESLTRLMS